MSGQSDIKVQLSGAEARAISQPVVIDVIRQETGEVVETVTILRYAGHYRADSVHAYAIKDAEGKFRVRGEFALGLNDVSPFKAFRSAAEPVYAA